MTLICAVSMSTQVLTRKRRSLHLRQGLPPTVIIKKEVHRKKLAVKDQKVEEPATSSDNEGSTKRPAKKPRTDLSASVFLVSIQLTLVSTCHALDKQTCHLLPQVLEKLRA